MKRCYTFEKDKTLRSITPHMHYRGKDVRYDLVRPDGRRETLLSVPRYNFEWQLVYRFKEPVFIEKGSVLTVTAHYDMTTVPPISPTPIRPNRFAGETRPKKR